MAIRKTTYGDFTKNGLHYIYAHYTVDTGELFYIGLGKYNRCNQINQRNKYWKNVYNKRGVRVEILVHSITCIELTKHIEKKLIAEFKPRTNILGGGQYFEGYTKPVTAYHKSGERYKSFDSITEANLFFNTSPNDSRISRCLQKERKTFKGYMWSTKNLKSIPKLVYNKRYNIKTVYRYNLDGDFVEKFESLKDFKGGIHTGICNTIDTDYTYKDSFWRSKYSPTINATKKKPALNDSVTVRDKSNGHIYKSISEAAKSLGCGTETLRRKLRGIRRNNTNLEII